MRTSEEKNSEMDVQATLYLLSGVGVFGTLAGLVFALNGTHVEAAVSLTAGVLSIVLARRLGEPYPGYAFLRLWRHFV
jgi:hypothetical protein